MIKDWEPFKLPPLPTGSGKAIGKVLGDKALFTLGGADGFRTRIVPLPSGGQLRVRTKNGMPEYIYEPRTGASGEPAVDMKVLAVLMGRLASLYMTSGAYKFGTLGGVNQTDPMLTVEPITYKSAAVAAGEAAELTPLYDKDPPENGEVSKIYNHTVNPGGLNGPKLDMMSRIPSEFSGLMRRCMQGRYGIGNTSSNMVGEEFEGSVSVGSTFGRTTGILRFGDLYFLVAITSGGGGMYGFYYPLHFPEECVELMVAGYSEAIETLCLAHAYVNPDEEGFLGNYTIAYGEPIAYGWNFSLTTNRATCVVNEMLAYGYDRRMYRLMSLVFGYNAETHTLTCAYTLDEEKDGWIAPAQAPIWSPSGGETIWYNQRSTSPAPTSAQDFPVHSYYAGDELNVVRWSWSSRTVAGSRDAHKAAYSEKAWSNSIFGEGGTSAEQLTRYGTVITSGFYIAGKSDPLTSGSSYWLDQGTLNTTYLGTEIFRKVGTFATESAYRWHFNPDIENSHNPRIAPWNSSYLLGTAYPPDAHAGNHWSYAEINHCSWAASFVSESGDEGHSSALVIPAHDCSSVYIGTKQTRNGSRTVSGSAQSTGSVAEVREWLCVKIKDQYGNIIGFEVAGEWTAPVKRQYCLAYQTNWGGPGTSTGSNTTSISDVTPVIIRHADAALPVGGVDSEIFYPGALRTKLLQQVTSITSALNNDARYNTETLSGGVVATTSGYPTDITLFVGAS